MTHKHSKKPAPTQNPQESLWDKVNERGAEEKTLKYNIFGLSVHSSPGLMHFRLGYHDAFLDLELRGDLLHIVA